MGLSSCATVMANQTGCQGMIGAAGQGRAWQGNPIQAYHLNWQVWYTGVPLSGKSTCAMWTFCQGYERSGASFGCQRASKRAILYESTLNVSVRQVQGLCRAIAGFSQLLWGIYFSSGEWRICSGRVYTWPAKSSCW